MVEKKNRRKYPRLYEQMIPIVIAVLVLIISGMLVITVGVALNLISL